MSISVALNEEMKWKNYEINFLNAHNVEKNVDGGLNNNNNMNKSLNWDCELDNVNTNVDKQKLRINDSWMNINSTYDWNLEMKLNNDSISNDYLKMNHVNELDDSSTVIGGGEMLLHR